MVELGVAGSWFGITFFVLERGSRAWLGSYTGSLNSSSLSVISPSPRELWGRWDCGSRAVF